MRQADEPGIINLAAGVPGPDALPADLLSEAFQRALQSDGAALFAYHHPEGDHLLRQLLANRLHSRGVSPLTPAQIVTTTGCTQALNLLLSLLVQPGNVVACEAPAYYGMLEILSTLRARVLPLPVRAEGWNLETTEALFREHQPACLVLCPTLSNPSGLTLPESQRAPLVDLCRKLGIRIVEDDIYGELAESGAPRPLLHCDPSGEVVSFVSSFSKTVSPGIRVGYCVPGTLHEAFAARKCQQDLHSCVVSEAILREFLAANALEPHLQWLRLRNRRRRQLAITALRSTFPENTTFIEPQGGYMLWINLPPKTDLLSLRERARAEGVVFASGNAFFTDTPDSPSIRLNCAKASETELVRGIEILGRLLCFHR